jgi:ribosomal RNA-processing protein 9
MSGKVGVKRPRNVLTFQNGNKKGPRSENKMQFQDEDISSSEDDGDDRNSNDDEGSEDEYNLESAESKRLRLAKQYLQQMGDTESNDGNDNSGDNDEDKPGDAISAKLKFERLRAKGELYVDHSDFFSSMDVSECPQKLFRGHNGSVTCIAATHDGKTVFTGSKDNSVILWDVKTGSKTVLKDRWSRSSKSIGSQVQCCEGEVLALAVSHDGRFVACGGRDNLVHVFDSRADYSQVHEFKGHRDAVTGLTFRMGTYSLFSGSLDRCLKHWDLNEMAYIETMFGHQV